MAKKRDKAKIIRSPVAAKQEDPQPTNGEVVHQMQEVLISAKVCRLCETKDGPFLNIFGGEKNTAKKIDEVMPFNVAENDELPHKICFRCSAKVEELHEFIQKCTKTQQNFYNTLGKKCPLSSKIKTHRSLWEETLHKSNISNDDICDAVIKKAMEGIKDITSQLEEPKIETALSRERISFSRNQPVTYSPKLINDTAKEKEIEPKKRNIIQSKDDDLESKTLNDKSKLRFDEIQKPPARSLRSRTNNSSSLSEQTKQIKEKANMNNSTYQSSQHTDTFRENKKIEIKEEPVLHPFNIMDHVIMIKVNGVGVLFQCKLCNRNFLKKEVVLSHWCAKNGTAKEAFTKKVTLPEVPKVPTVKYINTKTDNNRNSKSQRKINLNIETPSKEEPKEGVKPLLNKQKPRIGPASKVKKISNEYVPSDDMKVTPKELTPQLATEKKIDPSFVQCAVAPSLNCRYKLVPGPNNTFTLVEILQNVQNDAAKDKCKSPSKRKLTNENALDSPEIASKAPKVYQGKGNNAQTKPEIIDLDESSSVIDESARQPYPVGLFQSVKPLQPERGPSTSGLVPFATSAQKKQSYTIVQTGNPSKLLISAKPEHQVLEFQKKRSKKVKTFEQESISAQPFSVTLEDASPPSNAELFNFMHLDPLLQPSYVLPTDNSIIGSETQTSTSQQINEKFSKTKPVYTCNMCGSIFTREQKLLAHIHAHYDKMDEEDLLRQEKNCKKRGKNLN